MDDVIAAWWEHDRLARRTRQERKRLEQRQEPLAEAAAGHVLEAVRQGGPGALDLVRGLIVSAVDAEALGRVAAGPLEDLVHAHGDGLIVEIDRLARTDERFAAALNGVWLTHGVLDQRVEDRLAAWVTVTGGDDAGPRKRRG